MELVLGIDLGTSYCKCIVVDRCGRLCGLGRRLTPLVCPAAGYSEFPVPEFNRILRETIAEALQAAGAAPGAIKAVSYSSQANSFLLLNDTDEPLTPLIIWNDQRAADDIPDKLRQFWARPDFPGRTGIGFAPGAAFCLAKLCWLQRHQPEIWKQTKRIMTISDYLSFALTGEYTGDQSTAALLGAWDTAAGQWWAPALDAAGIAPEMLTHLSLPGTVVGKISGTGAECLGLKPGTLFAVGGLDHHQAGTGAGTGFLADCSVSLGTVLALLRFANDLTAPAGGCAGSAMPEQGFWQLVFSGNGATGIEWFQKLRTPQLSLPELDHLALASPPGCRGLRCLPEPVSKGRIENAFTGILPDHGPGDFIRAIMESNVTTLKELLSILFPQDTQNLTLAITGGGARSRPWLQIIKEMTGCRIVTTGNPEPACFGAAMTAAVAAGWFDSIEKAGKTWIKVQEQ